MNSLGCEISPSRRTMADDGLISVAASCCLGGCKSHLSGKSQASHCLRKGILENSRSSEMGEWGYCPRPLSRETHLTWSRLGPTHFSPIPTLGSWYSPICMSFLTSSGPHSLPSYTVLWMTESEVKKEQCFPPTLPQLNAKLPEAASLSHQFPHPSTTHKC